MSRELRIIYDPGATVTATLYNAATGASAIAAMVEGPAGYYVGDFPTLPRGTYDVAYSDGQSMVGAETLNWDGTHATVAVSPPTSPDKTTGYMVTYDGQGAVQPYVTIRFRYADTGSGVGQSFAAVPFTLTSDQVGLLQGAFVRGAKYVGQRGSGPEVEFIAGPGDTFALPKLLSGARGGAQ